MKTYNNLFAQITAFNNLLLAAQNAQKGKKNQSNVARFNLRLEEELFALQRELQEKSYRPGPYRSFMIHDPKERMISAAPYRDRVVHHALCNITAPIFERTFIHDSYANRAGKGTHAAIIRYQHYARKYPYVLKCDIRKFFPSIDHELLKLELRWKITCPDTLWLMDLIIDNSNPQESHLAYFPGDTLFTPHERQRGLPIGNLTSQWWGNIYLNRFDHFIKETLQAPGYIRYVDDFVLFAREKATQQEQPDQSEQ
ncbi:MAG: RNA-dependent DNA polymerase [Lewinellaceae bacterium]|nr:RNA-dependent DNA polymerase [Lewinellaceae bacterium]